jgi:hypothetical protein
MSNMYGIATSAQCTDSNDCNIAINAIKSLARYTAQHSHLNKIYPDGYTPAMRKRLAALERKLTKFKSRLK